MVNKYLCEAIQKKLKENFVNEDIFKNPRSSEIYETIMQYAKGMGILPKQDGYVPLYDSQIQARIRILLDDPSCLVVNERGDVVIKRPDLYEQFSKEPVRQETKTYEILQSGTMRRITEVKQEGEYEKEISVMDELGIEQAKTIEKNEKTLMIARVEGYPHIVKVYQKEQEKFYDISKTENLQNIQIEGALLIEGEMTQLPKDEQLRILQRMRYTPYDAGIRKMFNIKVKTQENIEREEV